MKRSGLLMAWCALALSWLAPERAAAYADFEIMVLDAPGEGFNDETPAAPIGGNTGTTRGAQRLQALQHAADIWGEAIDSEVVIRIEATYDPIECVGGFATTLAVGGTTYLDFVDTDEGELIFPTALADRLAADDLHPGAGDISITFNVNVDGGDCLDGARWYYGLDGNPGDDPDMIDTALHEIAHGLGMQSLYEPDTGGLISGVSSAFLTHVLDLDTGKHWHEMTDAERLLSQENAWRVAWDGEHSTAAGAALLTGGRPSVASPQVPMLSGFAADASYGAWTVATTVSGELAVDSTGECPEAVSGRIALMPWACAHSSWAASVEAEGAIAILVESPGDWELPVSPLEQPEPDPVGIPVVAISTADLGRFLDAAAMGTVTVELSIDEDDLLGADEDGRVLLNVTKPSTTSSIAHFEPLARPNLLMEPITAPRTLHDLDLTPAIMHDLGWAPFCGNGVINQDEECDEGDDNDDSLPDACRTTCREAGCGDHVLDEGEDCDDGEDNSDSEPDACRTTCVNAFCGDGVVDDDEACDDARNNSDRLADACRTTCIEPSCGDGVTDTGEGCDDGADNDATTPDACRPGCVAPRCGDGVVDTGEACDEGAANDDAATSACATDCQPPMVDPSMQPGGDGGASSGDGDGDGAGDGGGDGGDDGGCGCRVVRRSEPSARALAGVLALWSVLATRRRRRAPS